MAQIDLSKYGISNVLEIVHNPSYEALFEAEMDPTLEGFEKGQLTELGAVNVMTGIYTGRSPKDKYIVMDENSKDTVWWTSKEFPNDNKPMTQATWAECKRMAAEELSGKKLYVQDVFCGTNKDSAWPSASSWKWHGRHTSSRICSSLPPLRSWPTSSLTSSATTLPRPR